MHRSAMPHFRHGIDQLEALIHSGQCFDTIGAELREFRKPTKRVRALLATIGSPADEPSRAEEPVEAESAPGPAPVLVVVAPAVADEGPSVKRKPIVTPQLPALAGMTPLGITGSERGPMCHQCKRRGHGVLFSLTSPNGFGAICVDCEASGNG